MKIGIIAPAIIFLVSVTGQASFRAAQQPRPTQRKVEEASNDSLTEDLSKGASFTFRIAANLPPVTFKVIPELREPDSNGNAQTIVRDIEVYRGDSTQPFQHLEGCDSKLEPPPARSDWFRAEDFNFDGYLDIYVLRDWGATGNYSGCVWLYNPKTALFEYTSEFSELCQPRLDPESKTIFTFENGGGGTYSAQRYEVEDNHLVLIWSQDRAWNQEKQQFHCVVEELHGHEIVTVREIWSRNTDKEIPCEPGTLFQDPKPSKPSG